MEKWFFCLRWRSLLVFLYFRRPVSIETKKHLSRTLLERIHVSQGFFFFFFFTFLEVCYFFLNLFREIYFASTSPYYMYHSEVNHWFDHIRLLRTVSEKSNLNIIKAWRPRLHNYFYLFNELNAACRSLGIQSSCFPCLSMSKHVILCKRYIYHYFSTAAEIDLTIDWSLK